MNANKTVFMSCGGSYSSGLPYTFEPEDFDSWPSDQAKAEVMFTISEILKQGYKGVKVETFHTAELQVLGKFFVDLESPEGRTVNILFSLARVGATLPTSEVMVILGDAYRYNGLAFPTRSGGAK